MKPLDVLHQAAWAQFHFGSLCGGRALRRRDILRCVRDGLMESVGMVEGCDGDGFTLVPSRYAEGFVMTDAGRVALRGAVEPDDGPITLQYLDYIERIIAEDAENQRIAALGLTPPTPHTGESK